MAIVQPFAMAGLFLISGAICLARSRSLAGLPVAAVGFFVMALGEPFLGFARIKPDYVTLGNWVQGTTLPVGATIVLVGLYLIGPKRS